MQEEKTQSALKIAELFDELKKEQNIETEANEDLESEYNDLEDVLKDMMDEISDEEDQMDYLMYMMM